jgi:hypothetical protein
VVPSPKFHEYCEIVPSASVDAAPENDATSPVLEELNRATGGWLAPGVPATITVGASRLIELP